MRDKKIYRAVPNGLRAAESVLKLVVGYWWNWRTKDLPPVSAHKDMHQGCVLGLGGVFCAILFWGALWGAPQENREEGVASFSHGAPWPTLVLERLWTRWSCCGAWVTKCNENWGGTGPLSVQNTGLSLISRRVRRQPFGHGQECLLDGDYNGQKGEGAFVKLKYWNKEELCKVGSGCPVHKNWGKTMNLSYSY